MTTINAILTECYTDPAANFGGNEQMRHDYERNILSQQVNQYLRDAAAAHQGWLYFAGLIRRYAGCSAFDAETNLHPDEMKKVCADLKLSTMDQLSAWVEANGNIDAEGLLTDISNSPPALPPLRTAGYVEVIQRILAAPNIHCDADLFRGNDWISDNTYQMLTDEALDLLCAKCPAKKFQWRPECQDCDDFTRMVRGWISSGGYGNVTAFACSIWGVDEHGNGTGEAHSLLICVTETRVVFWEGQNGRHDLDSKYFPQDIGVKAVGNVIYRMEM